MGNFLPKYDAIIEHLYQVHGEKLYSLEMENDPFY